MERPAQSSYLALEAIMKYEVEQLNKIRVPTMVIGIKCVKICKYGSYSAFSKTQLPLELWLVLSCESPAVFLHTPLEEKGALGTLLSVPAGASKRETPTSNLTESTGS